MLNRVIRAAERWSTLPVLAAALLTAGCHQGALAGNGADCRSDDDCRRGFRCVDLVCQTADATDGGADDGSLSELAPEGGSDAAAEPAQDAEGADTETDDWPIDANLAETGSVADADLPDAATCDGCECGQEGCSRTIAQISAGIGHTCVLYSDHTLHCWGANGAHQAEPPPGLWKMVAAGADHTCALRLDDTVACWGLNESGQASPPEGHYATLTAGRVLTCALDQGGGAVCWGQVPPPPPNTAFTQIAAGDAHVCGLTAAGSALCWGDNSSQQSAPPAKTYREIGSGNTFSCGLGSDGLLTCWGREVDSHPPADHFKHLLVGYDSACALGEDDRWTCFNGSYHLDRTGPGSIPPPPGLELMALGQTRGYGVQAGRLIYFGPFPAAALDPPRATIGQMACDGYSSAGCVLLDDHSPYCWGSEVPTPEGLQFDRLGAGAGFICGLVRGTGKPVCWGDLGASFVPPPGPFVEIAGGSEFACGLSSGGAIQCWGSQWVPRQAPQGAFVHLSAGLHGACALDVDGRVACWEGGLEPYQRPDTFIDVSVGDPIACGVRTDKTLSCWYGAAEASLNPPSGTFTAVSVAAQFACAIRTDGTLACWGDGMWGRLNVPAGRFTAVDAGGPCARRTDGRLVCWGGLLFDGE